MFTNINHLKSKRAKIKELLSLNSFIFVYYCLFCLLLEYLKYLLSNEISSLRSFRVVIFYFALYLGKPYHLCSISYAGSIMLQFYRFLFRDWRLQIGDQHRNIFVTSFTWPGGRFQAIGCRHLVASSWLWAVGNLR